MTLRVGPVVGQIEMPFVRRGTFATQVDTVGVE